MVKSYKFIYPLILKSSKVCLLQLNLISNPVYQTNNEMSIKNFKNIDQSIKYQRRYNVGVDEKISKMTKQRRQKKLSKLYLILTLVGRRRQGRFRDNKTHKCQKMRRRQQIKTTELQLPTTQMKNPSNLQMWR